MRRITNYIHQHKNWPEFQWNDTALLPLLGKARHAQGRLLGKMESLGFTLRKEAVLETISEEVIKSSEIEGEILQLAQVRSSIARKLGMNIPGLIRSDRYTDGVVEMMLDATQKFKSPLTKERLFGWHAALFPTKISTGKWRTDAKGPMQVVSGALGKERIHYQAPDAKKINTEMTTFLKWFNKKDDLDPVIKAGIAHLWFITIHPFEDGNGRIALAIMDMQLTRAEENAQRFYSMSAQIRLKRNDYYSILEKTQKGNMDISNWLGWYLECMLSALNNSEKTLKSVLKKANFWDKHKLTALNERQHKMLNKLWDGFEGNLTSTKWAKLTKCSPDTALRDIQDLLQKKILAKEDSGGRSTSYTLI